jgi:hypothetical protein
VNKYVDHLFSELGIELQQIVPYTPQHNGVVKRKNMTLKEMANCMLQDRSLPPKLWVEAINYVYYI